MNQTIKDLLERRSIRKYKSEQISNEELDIILKAGSYAPSSMGKQSAILIAVQDKETIEELEKLNASFSPNPKSKPFYGAPTVVLVLGDKNNKNNIKDGSLCMGNMMNAAHSLNIGSCWINRVYETFESEEGKVLLKKWGVDGEYSGVGACILGYPDCERPNPAVRKENYIYYIK
ncbi:nitroreductase family protein [Clostridium intestinale]|uniref:nitroreductase family protein n=1 Tax=Clostridium intestinale TaxID=36845 RepID=UPI002DD630A1|nr:nitroreductase family protein [Clostridium intestinale]WRY53657.1 nitroreductase family protein [Clostridium intestinale]